MTDTTIESGAEPKPNRRQQAKARTRARVLTAATELFARDGYAAATIRDIAKRAGMSTGAVFANFKDKAALYRAIHGHDPVMPEVGAEFFTQVRALINWIDIVHKFPHDFGGPDAGRNLRGPMFDGLRELVGSVPADPAEDEGKAAA